MLCKLYEKIIQLFEIMTKIILFKPDSSHIYIRPNKKMNQKRMKTMTQEPAKEDRATDVASVP